METSKNVDRERRRTKLRRKSWTHVLLHPRTINVLVLLGRLIAFVVWLIFLIIGKFKE